MKKKALSRGLLGFPLGIAIGCVIGIILSLGWGNGHYNPCVPELVEKMGSEINAITLQTVLCGLLGSAFAASSAIWEMEHWSIARQTGIYFAITAVVMMPIAYFMRWMEHSVSGFLSYFGIFIIIFIVFWAVSYLVWRDRIKKMNRGIETKRESF
jgi:hypothetical protein